MSFDFCMNWPFKKPAAPTRNVQHHLTAPVPGGGGTSLGVFTSPMGNDLVISKPMTASLPGQRRHFTSGPKQLDLIFSVRPFRCSLSPMILRDRKNEQRYCRRL